MLSIVIPTWNGLHLLRETLPSVIEAADCFSQQSGRPHEIIVVDDGSRDRTVEALPLEFPTATLMPRADNGGFAIACNTGFERCRHPVVALLNNDVRVSRDYFAHLVPHFQDPDVFAVTARVFEWDEPIFATGGKVARLRRGFWSAYFNYDVGADEASQWIEKRDLLSFYAVGGFAAYDREKLLQLKGFNELLSPFHWEDIDLSYRGWKRGWTVRYEPRSVAFHRTSATIEAHYKPRAVEVAATRNRLLFHWINIHDRWMLLKHLLMVALLGATRIWAGDVGFYRALAGACRRLRPAFRLREEERTALRRSDKQLTRLLNDFYNRAPIRIYYNRAQVVRSHPGQGVSRKDAKTQRTESEENREFDRG